MNIVREAFKIKRAVRGRKVVNGEPKGVVFLGYKEVKIECTYDEVGRRSSIKVMSGGKSRSFLIHQGYMPVWDCVNQALSADPTEIREVTAAHGWNVELFSLPSREREGLVEVVGKNLDSQ